MLQELKFQLSTAILTVLTIAAAIAAALNYQQNQKFRLPDDGVVWRDQASQVVAVAVQPNSPGDRAGIRIRDVLKTIQGSAVRTTDDVDILIEATEENAVRVWQALDGLRDHAVRELTPPDLLEGVVVVGDEFQVDVSIHAWKVSYPDAIGTAREVVLEGVRVPYLGYDMLIASKQTYREKDQLDLLQIRALKDRL